MLQAEMDAIAKEFPEGAPINRPDALHEVMFYSNKVKEMERANNLDKEIEEWKLRIQEVKRKLELQDEQLKKQEHKKRYLQDQHHKEETMLMKLYAIISKIHFYGDVSEDEIKGAVVGKQVVPFHLSKKEHDTFYITNYLWDMITNSD